MSDPDPDLRPRPFTLRQRRGLLLVCAAMLVCVAVGLLLNRSFVDDPIPNRADRYLELQDKIDPNDADVALLAALPALGERRAADIVAFREKQREISPGRAAFRRPEDLMQIRGIGGAIVDQVRPYLRFPEATTQESR